MFACISSDKCYFNLYKCLLFLSLCMQYSIVTLNCFWVLESCGVQCIADIFKERAASIFTVELWM
jgi:hypothetical protein